MTGQTLQKVEQSSLSNMLQIINHNFALLQNSPFFKGIPGEPGDKGDQGIQGDRGTKIFCAVFYTFKTYFPSLQSQPITALSASFINNLLQSDIDSSSTENYNKICEALGVESTDSLMNDDMIIFQSDMTLYRYNQDNNQLIDTGVKFVTESDAQNTIQNLVSTAMTNYINSLQVEKINLKQYNTIATNDGVNAPLSINQLTSYFPYLEGMSLPQRINTTTDISISSKLRHKYFAIDDEETKLSTTSDESFGVTMVVGPLRKYIETLSKGTDQNKIGNLINPSYDRMPSMVLMQNDYNSGLLIGNKDARNMSEYSMIYRNSDGELCLRREHRWVLDDSSQPVTEFVIGGGQYIFNGNLMIDSGYSMKSDFLDSYTLTEGIKTISLGYGTDSIINFRSEKYKFENITPLSILELDANNLLKTSENHIFDDDGSVTTNNPLTYFNDEYINNYSDDLQYKIPSKKTIALMFKAIKNELDNIWYKDDFYNETEDIIPELSLYKSFKVGTFKDVNGVYQDFAPIRTTITSNLLDSTLFDTVSIGVYNTYDKSNNTKTRIHSRMNMEVDWNKLMIAKLPSYSILATDENQFVYENFGYANPAETFEDDVVEEVLQFIQNNDVDNNSFDKFINEKWINTDNEEKPGFSSINHTNDVGSRVLTGRHFKLFMRMFAGITGFIKNNYVKQSEFNKVKEQDLVPAGAIIAWNPSITKFVRIQSSIQQSSNNSNTSTIIKSTVTSSNTSKITLDGISTESQSIIDARNRLNNGTLTMDNVNTLINNNELTGAFASELITSGFFNNTISNNTLSGDLSYTENPVNPSNINVDFNIPYGWVPCMGYNLYEVGPCTSYKLGKTYKIYRTPDLRDKAIIGYTWSNITNINQRLVANANYEPDKTTIDNETQVPLGGAASSIEDGVGVYASSLMSQTKSETSIKSSKIRTQIANTQTLSTLSETSDYYVKFVSSDNGVTTDTTSINATINDKVFTVPSIRLAYIMKTPKPIEGRGLYVKLSTTKYLRIYPTPADQDTSNNYPMIITVQENSSEYNSAVVDSDNMTVVVNADSQTLNSNGTITNSNSSSTVTINASNLTDQELNNLQNIIKRSSNDTESEENTLNLISAQRTYNKTVTK